MSNAVAGEMLPDIAVCRELATALRAGDDSAAAGLAARAGIPRWLLTHLELGPRGRLDVGDAGEALACISGLAAGRAVTLVPWLAKPTVIDLVAEAVETAVVPGTTAEHPWAQGIAALEGSGRPALPMLLRARAEEGSGRSDRAHQLIESCLRIEEDLLPAVDLMIAATAAHHGLTVLHDDADYRTVARHAPDLSEHSIRDVS